MFGLRKGYVSPVRFVPFEYCHSCGQNSPKVHKIRLLVDIIGKNTLVVLKDTNPQYNVNQMNCSPGPIQNTASAKNLSSSQTMKMKKIFRSSSSEYINEHNTNQASLENMILRIQFKFVFERTFFYILSLYVTLIFKEILSCSFS